MNLDLTVTLIITVINFVLVILIARNNIKARANQYFILFLLFLIAWKVSLYFYLSALNEDHLLAIGRINFAVSSLVMFFAFKFAENFADSKIRLIKSNLVNFLTDIFTLGILLITLITPLVSEQELIISGEKQTIFGSLYSIYFAHLLLFLLLTLVSLYIKVRKTKDYQKEQAKLILTGFIISAVFTITTNVVLPYIFNIFSLQVIGALGTIPISVTVGLSIIKYRFLDTKVIFAKILHILLMTVFVYSFFQCVIILYLLIFEDIFSAEALTIGVFIAIFFVLIYDQLNNYVKEKIENPIIYGKTSPEEIIAKVSYKMSNETNIQGIVNYTHSILKDYWNNDKTYIILNIDNKVEIYDGIGKIDSEETIIKLTQSIKPTEEVILLDPPYSDLDRVIDFKRIAYLPEFKELIKNINIKLIIPLYFSGELFGIIMMNNKKDDVYNWGDIQTLRSIANITALSIKRSKLFEEIENFNKTLQIKVDQATKQLQEKNTQLQEQLRREKDMMDILGHELRTPLSIARNAILMMQASMAKIHETETQTQLTHLLEKATENIRREVKILETVLSSTRIENNRLQIIFEKVDIKDAINDAIDGNDSEAEKKGLKLYSEVPAEELFVTGGRDQVQEIIDNLVSNAIKYTQKGEIKITLTKDDNFGIIAISDTGEGIPAEAIPNLGKKFFRVNPYLQDNDEKLNIIRPGGTGIGLYVVFNLIRMMKGTIDIKSEVGQGSTFTVKLPLHKVIETAIEPQNT